MSADLAIPGISKRQRALVAQAMAESPDATTQHLEQYRRREISREDFLWLCGDNSIEDVRHDGETFWSRPSHAQWRFAA